MQFNLIWFPEVQILSFPLYIAAACVCVSKIYSQKQSLIEGK